MNYKPVTWKASFIYGERYEVNNFGEVRNKQTGKILSQYNHNKGYKVVDLSLKNKKIAIRVHRLVAKVFISNPENKPQINHKDGNKTNNYVDNLEWVTAKENSQHAIKMGLSSRFRGPVIAFDPKTMKKIARYNCAIDAAKSTGVDASFIASVCNGYPKRRTANGLVWRYESDVLSNPECLTNARYLKYKPVEQYTLDGKLVQTWDSIKIAAKHFGVVESTLRNACHEEWRTSVGYRWKYSQPELHREVVNNA